jgi:acyl-CoA hydrolase
VARAAVETAKYVIAQVNPRMPRTHGDGFLSVQKIDALVWHETELPEVNYSEKTNEGIAQIGRNVASLIEDGATLQMGIGAIPDQVLTNLASHKNLGIHTEMFSDGVIPLIENGVITNSHKKLNVGRVVTGFLAGTRKLYDFVHDNPAVRVMDISYVNDTSVIRQNPKATAINSAIEIDLTGQVCADSIGTLQFSGIGGQMDFMRGASLSNGGKPIIALPSVTSKGASRIVPFLKEGAGVVTTRGHVHWVVTEHGIVNLFGQNLKQRAKALIGIAHPDHREALERAFYERFKSKVSIV